MAKHAHEEFKKVETLQDRMSAKITKFAGSITFVYVNALIFLLWIVYNLAADEMAFDPFPFGLLTLIVSLEAIFLSTFVMLTQNRESKRTDVRAQLDYEVTVKAEKEVEEIKSMLQKISRKLGE